MSSKPPVIVFDPSKRLPNEWERYPSRSYKWAPYAVAGVIFIALVFLLSGCWFTPSKPPTPAPPAATVQASASALTVAEAQVKEKVAANVETARKSNAGQPETPAKAAVEGELSIAATRLAAKADPEELLAGEQRARALAEGRTEEARKLYSEASKQATEDAKARAVAEADLKSALTSLEVANAKAERDIARLNERHAKELQAARNEVMRDQVKWLNRAGAICAALAIGCVGLCLSFGGLVALKVAAPFAACCGVASLACFGLAQIVGQWWFKWAALGGCAVIVAVVGAWLWRHARQGNLKQEAEHRAEKLAGVTRAVIPALDEAYDKAEAPIKEWLDAHIFSALSSKMDAAQKKAVHEVRAEVNQP